MMKAQVLWPLCAWTVGSTRNKNAPTKRALCTVLLITKTQDNHHAGYVSDTNKIVQENKGSV